ncbi:LysR family transcriptional regulator [Biostraticola tofi]|uniref:DNA-binding transcriptional LysR family regulator n=1 Tax=Biostraticola tofi TaxID=466109 RepID=A0A4V2W3X3_9GAMM|nr:LysR family transcriptional regulator [Biostraticola tofi]TCV93719.1 DNA-binding transcriptional LysR family regulator [Biostraticola tofi]
MSKLPALSDMDIRQLEAFSSVIKHGGVTAAARALNRSQPSVTRMIQELEMAIGYSLFTRSGPRIRPTSQALRLHEYVEHALIALHQINQRALEIGREEQSPLIIACTSAMASGLVPAALKRVNTDQPVHLLNDSAEQTMHAVINGVAEIGICSLPLEHSGVTLHGIGKSRCVLVVNQDDPLAADNPVSLASLADRPLISPYHPYRLRHRFERSLKNSHLNLKHAVETNSSVNILSCVRAGLGVAIVEPITAYGVPVAGVAVRELDIDIPYYFGIVTPQGKPIRPAVLLLIDAVQQVAAAMLTEFSWLGPEHHKQVMSQLRHEAER